MPVRRPSACPMEAPGARWQSLRHHYGEGIVEKLLDNTDTPTSLNQRSAREWGAINSVFIFPDSTTRVRAEGKTLLTTGSASGPPSRNFPGGSVFRGLWTSRPLPESLTVVYADSRKRSPSLQRSTP
ncbi:hypothetical protein ZHAS_00018667 [Anopheles sinensis]|uniref:Uncharacterized protein n=1 Tax=Anopheles sinensis TaxID=74873 RepID=A0A084WK91_ANOSI|nr:hypothetical protein ZHAS_00018667 [Anopheles sinensis]